MSNLKEVHSYFDDIAEFAAINCFIRKSEFKELTCPRKDRCLACVSIGKSIEHQKAQNYESI